MTTTAPQEIREHMTRVIEDARVRRFNVLAPDMADNALAVIEAAYPGCWEILERAKAADHALAGINDFVARRMNE